MRTPTWAAMLMASTFWACSDGGSSDGAGGSTSSGGTAGASVGGSAGSSGGAGGSGGTAGDPLRSEYTLSSNDSVPEGIAFHPGNREFFVSSLNGGSITGVGADGTETELRAADGGTVIGLAVDAPRDRLWACAGDSLLVYDLQSRSLMEELDLTAADPAAGCNDLITDDSGVAYVTDSGNPNLYRAELGSAPTLFATSPLFTAPLIGLNGIEITADQTYLLAGVFADRRIVRISIADPTDIMNVDITGDMTETPDGVVLLDGDLYIVASATVQRVQFGADFLTGTAASLAQPSGLSTGTVAEGRLFVVKSEVTNFVLGAPLDLPFQILEVDLTAFP